MADLHSLIEPYAAGMLEVGDGNVVYWETGGNPDGKPALVVHGGPGSGAPSSSRRYFDPGRYRVVLFDPRGCGRSTPHASDPSTDMRVKAKNLCSRHLIRMNLAGQSWAVSGGQGA